MIWAAGDSGSVRLRPGVNGELWGEALGWGMAWRGCGAESRV